MDVGDFTRVTKTTPKGPMPGTWLGAVYDSKTGAPVAQISVLRNPTELLLEPLDGPRQGEGIVVDLAGLVRVVLDGTAPLAPPPAEPRTAGDEELRATAEAVRLLAQRYIEQMGEMVKRVNEACERLAAPPPAWDSSAPPPGAATWMRGRDSVDSGDSGDSGDPAGWQAWRQP